MEILLSFISARHEETPLRQIETNLTTLHGWLDSSAPKVARELIWLDGRRLFTIAAPALQEDERQRSTLSPIETRVQIIQDRLTQVIQTGFDPDSLRVSVETDTSSRQPVIYLRYTHDGQAQVKELMTITALDALKTALNNCKSVCQHIMEEFNKEREQINA